MKRFAHAFSIAAVSLLLGCHSLTYAASDYPSKNIRAIIPFPAGGINDTVARLFFTQAAKALGKEVIIDNRPGAGGMIGTRVAVDSKPDGYTVLLGAASTISVAPSLYKDVKYNPSTDLIAVGGIAAVPSVMLVNKDAAFQSLQALIEQARQEPGSLNYGSAGSGTSHHVQTEMLALDADIEIIHVPYQGGAPAMTDLIGGQLQMLLEPLPTALPHIESGRVRALGITQKDRSELLPAVPTFDEAGVPGYEATTWFGVFVPSDTPAPIVSFLSQAIDTSLEDPAFIKDLQQRGITPMPMSQDQFQAFVNTQNSLWKNVITKAKLQIP